MTNIGFEDVYRWLQIIAAYKIHGVLLCKLLVPFLALLLFGVSRAMDSWPLKVFAVVVGLVLYNFPTVVNWLLPVR